MSSRWRLFLWSALSFMAMQSTLAFRLGRSKLPLAVKQPLLTVEHNHNRLVNLRESNTALSAMYPSERQTTPAPQVSLAELLTPEQPDNRSVVLILAFQTSLLFFTVLGSYLLDGGSSFVASTTAFGLD
eukprot:gene39502-53410_t